MRESRTPGSARGAVSNHRPYRDPQLPTMLRLWTDAAARMTAGETARTLGQDLSTEAPDGASALGLSPARLTLTFGFGAGLFMKDGADRYGLAAKRPEALVDLPKFNGDQLQPARTGGDISVQACADDPLVAFHALRELDRLSYGAAQIRWAQTGFLPNTPPGETPRNLIGFKDGIINPPFGDAPATPDAPRGFDDVVWVGAEGPDWMRGGSYLVARRIRISLEHWDRTEVDFQEQVIGRHKYSGAPIGKSGEQDLLDLDRLDKDGNPLIADNAHARLGPAAVNDDAQILRRGYSYNNGVSFTAERWPPWHQGTQESPHFENGLISALFGPHVQRMGALRPRICRGATSLSTIARPELALQELVIRDFAASKCQPPVAFWPSKK